MKPALDDSIIALWQNKRVFIAGDVMLDRFVTGIVERISPEAPIPVLRFQSEKLILGGAANVARNIRALGGVPLLVGALGGDSDGDLIASTLCPQDQIDGFFLRIPDHPTTVKTRYVSSGQQILRLDVEQPFVLTKTHRAEICAHFFKHAATIDALVVSDYAKGFLSPDLTRQLIKIARDHAIAIVVDPKSRDVSHYAGASVLTPNAAEAAMITGRDCGSDDASIGAVKAISDLTAAAGVVLTRGIRGMTIYDPIDAGSEPFNISAEAFEVFDVTGAGDTVSAVLSLALSAKRSLAEAASIANIAAGLVVGKRGTAVVRAHELSKALTRQADPDPKIASMEAASAIVQNWRDQGQAIGFTNGCFDLLHPGHISLLQKARAICDRLIVGLNSDASVKRLKGETRPLQKETARATVLASLSSTDLVVIFDEDTPIRLIELFKPDVLLKGADYTIDTVVGADIVSAHGGKVVLIPLENGYSTTATLARASSNF